MHIELLNHNQLPIYCKIIYSYFVFVCHIFRRTSNGFSFKIRLYLKFILADLKIVFHSIIMMRMSWKDIGKWLGGCGLNTTAISMAFWTRPRIIVSLLTWIKKLHYSTWISNINIFVLMIYSINIQNNKYFVFLFSYDGDDDL